MPSPPAAASVSRARPYAKASEAVGVKGDPQRHGQWRDPRAIHPQRCTWCGVRAA